MSAAFTSGKHNISLALLVSSVFLLAPGQASPATIPRLHGTTFTGVHVDLPEGLGGKIGIFVVGFSEASREPVTLWGKKLAVDFYDSPHVAYYEMPVIASVPKLLRGFVQGRIKASVSDRGKPHFLPITEDESAWRSLVHYAAPDAPYIVLVDGSGDVRWQTQEAPNDATYAALLHQIDLLRPARTQ